MAPRDPHPPGSVIEWLDILGDGREVDRAGVVHSAAPRFGLMRSWWVDVTDGLADGETVAGGNTGRVRVVQRGKRGPVGQQTPWHPQELALWEQLSGTAVLTRSSATRWRSAGGRVVERGTIYREVDARSLLAQSTTKLREQHEGE